MAGTVGSLAGLFVFAIGVPILLVIERAGLPFGPVASVFSHPSSVLHSLDHPVTNSVVIHVVVVVAWLTWGWLVTCVVTEVVARLRGRPPSPLPASRRAQALAALVVGASMAFLPPSRISAPMRIVGTDAVPRTEQVLTLVDKLAPGVALSSDRSELGVADKPFDSPSRIADGREYTVQAGDTLWGIAERELGSPLRWRQIASLNLGRPQSDGMSLIHAGWILPGWVLVLPSSDGASTEAAVKETDKALARSTRRASGYSIDRPGDRPDIKFPPPRGPLSTPRPMPRPMPRPVVVTTDPVAESAPPTNGGTAKVPHAENQQASKTSDGAQARNVIPVAPFGYGLLGAGVVVVINRLRRAQQRHRPSGLRIALPDKELAGAEQRLRSSADHEAAAWVDVSLRTLAAACRSQGRECPESGGSPCPGSRHRTHSRPINGPGSDRTVRTAWQQVVVVPPPKGRPDRRGTTRTLGLPEWMSCHPVS